MTSSSIGGLLILCTLFTTVYTKLIRFPLFYQSASDDSTEDSSWDYDDFEAWGNISATCNNGRRQSPISLNTDTAISTPIPSLKFYNYFIPLQTPIILTNDGHTVNMDVPDTVNGQRPSLSGAQLNYKRYNAINVHFHWGSWTRPGSEHVINGRPYDVEMHIVHRNIDYETTEEALKHRDGLAVLGVMLNVVNNRKKAYNGLNKIFNRLPYLIYPNSEAEINSRLSLGDLLGEIDLNDFFTYSGSLTTPPCAEVVTWFVFKEPIPIAAEQVSKLFYLLDSKNKPMLENFRPLQPKGKRLIFQKTDWKFVPYH